jgi:hypothetical protein
VLPVRTIGGQTWPPRHHSKTQEPTVIYPAWTFFVNLRPLFYLAYQRSYPLSNSTQRLRLFSTSSRGEAQDRPRCFHTIHKHSSMHEPTCAYSHRVFAAAVAATQGRSIENKSAWRRQSYTYLLGRAGVELHADYG